MNPINMSAAKLSSEEVPHKLIEWLLNMGYPAKIPSIDKVTQKCRGHYYMVWRSLMEHVHPKDEIGEKRLKVFCDDVTMCQKNNVFDERNTNVVIPEQLLLWQQHEEEKKKVANVEARELQARQFLNQLMDKVSRKICQRNLSRKRVEDKQRRVWLLRQVFAELAVKTTNMKETMDIANSLCCLTNDDDLQDKMDKCLGLLHRHGAQAASLSMLTSLPIASSSYVSSHGDNTEEQLASLARCRGDALWPLLGARRNAPAAHLRAALAPATVDRAAPAPSRSPTQTVLTHTASLHCTLSLETMKNRAHIKQIRAKFATCLEDISEFVSGAACELLVVRCERASAEGSARAARTLSSALRAKSGVFSAAAPAPRAPPTQISDVNKAIEITRDKLKRLILSLDATERKINSVKDALIAVFNSFHNNVPIEERYQDVQLRFPQESIPAICQFYEERQERNKAELSLDLNVSDSSFNNSIDLSNLTFVDEFRIYLKKFNLEKNRKIVVDSGEKIWTFETLESSLNRLYSKWLDNDGTALCCPSANLLRNIKRIITMQQTKNGLENVLHKLNCDRQSCIVTDVKGRKEQEEIIIDKIKKQIGENISNLQKSAKLLELSQKNLHLWETDEIKKWISNNRTVDGKTYRDYEAFYIEALTLNT